MNYSHHPGKGGRLQPQKKRETNRSLFKQEIPHNWEKNKTGSSAASSDSFVGSSYLIPPVHFPPGLEGGVKGINRFLN